MSDLIGLPRLGHEEVAIKLEHLLVRLHLSSRSGGDGWGRRVQGVLVLGL